MRKAFTGNPKMEKVDALLAFLAKSGVQITVSGNDLVYQAPRGVMSDDLKEAIRNNKQSLIATLEKCSDRYDCLVPLSGLANREYLVVCAHTAHGGVLDYCEFASRLSSNFGVVAVHALNYLLNCKPLTSVFEMAQRYVEQVQPVIGSAKTIVFGASSGGLIALEIAQILSSIGKEPALLVLGDTLDVERHKSKPKDHLERIKWISFAEIYLGKAAALNIIPRSHVFWSLDEQARLNYIASNSDRLDFASQQSTGDAFTGHFEAYSAYTLAYFQYELSEYSGDSIYIKVKAHDPSESRKILSMLTGNRRIAVIDGEDHVDIVKPQSMRSAAEIVIDHLAEFNATQ